MIPTPEEVQGIRDFEVGCPCKNGTEDCAVQNLLALLDEVFEKIGEAVELDWIMTPTWGSSSDADKRADALEALRDLREKYGKGAK